LVFVEESIPAKPSNRKIEWLVWGLVILTVLGIAIAFVQSRLERRNLIDLRPIAQLPSFTLTNQDARPFSLDDLRGSVCVADIIFTRCAGPCPIMTQRMSELQGVLPANEPVKLLTLTTDPEFDTPEVLKRYGQKFKANFARWNFVSGSKEGIARVAVDGMKLAAVEKQPQERQNERDLFIHSQLFVLLDKQGRVRGAVESYDPEMKQKILTAVKYLLREKS
jgi:protein SCO1/2